MTEKKIALVTWANKGLGFETSRQLGSLTLHSDPQAGIDQIKPFAYDASKTAVNQFTVHLAALLKNKPIKVNSAHPGWVKTISAEKKPRWRRWMEPKPVLPLLHWIVMVPSPVFFTWAKPYPGRGELLQSLLSVKGLNSL